MDFKTLYHYYFLQKALYPTIQGTGIEHFIERTIKSRGIIIMLHRVAEDRNTDIHFSLNKQWLINQSILRNIIEQLTKLNYTFLSMDEILPYIHSNEKGKFAAFTLDDGYRDNLDIAYPIFKDKKIPFTIYLSPGLINKESFLSEYLFEDLLINSKSLVFRKNRTNLTHLNLTEKEVLFQQLIKFYDSLDSSITVKSLLEFCNLNEYDYTIAINNLLLNWNDIKELNNDSLVTFGSHTYNHSFLNKLSDSQSKFEIFESKRYIETKLLKQVNHFAYPYGRKEHFTIRDFNMVKKANYLTGVTSEYGNIYSNYLSQPLLLPRINVNGLINQKSLLSIINGTRSFIYNNFSKKVEL